MQGAAGGDSDAEKDEEEAEEETPQQAPAPSKWALLGKLAGRKAADDSVAGREYSVSVPTAVHDAGEEAFVEYMQAFDLAFESVPKPSSPQDAVVPGLVLKKKRRASNAEVNKVGAAGLNESAPAVVTNVVYPQVRAEYFLNDDDGEAAVRAALRSDGFVFSDAEFEEWWERAGHKLTRTKAKSARYAVGEAVKEAIWLKHGAPRGGRACNRVDIARPQSARRRPLSRWATSSTTTSRPVPVRPLSRS